MSRSIVQSQLDSLVRDLPSGSSTPVVRKPVPKGQKAQKRSSGQKTKVSSTESIEFVELRKKSDSMKQQKKERTQAYMLVTAGKRIPGRKQNGRPASEHINKLLQNKDL